LVRCLPTERSEARNQAPANVHARIAIQFSHDFEEEQLYLFHCHILEHEDAGTMLNYKSSTLKARLAKGRGHPRGP
jgi:FtsP/CotA-like multicopper oxidase with cupredoxin domain